jgi:hypothetical protein
VRTLTEAEAQVIGSLLASTLVTERSRLKRAQVPRSTYHAARRRAYAEGWLRDRYIPNPVEFGLPFASFSLVRPFADRVPEFLAGRSADPGTVYLAAGSQIALAIGFYAERKEADRVGARPIQSSTASWSFPLTADLREPSVPVFFDYEGSFAHLGGAEGAEGYPQGVGGRPPGSERSDPELRSRRGSWAATELVHRPFVAVEEGRGAHRIGPLGLPWGQQKMLNQGWIVHRVLLDPARLPPFRGRSADQQVFVVGTFRANARPEELFASLTRDCRVFPFLYAAADGRFLMGALGRPPGEPPESADVRPRRSVMATLQERVEGIEILQEPAGQFRLELDHRYDRLFPRKAG